MQLAWVTQAQMMGSRGASAEPSTVRRWKQYSFLSASQCSAEPSPCRHVPCRPSQQLSALAATSRPCVWERPSLRAEPKPRTNPSPQLPPHICIAASTHKDASGHGQSWVLCISAQRRTTVRAAGLSQMPRLQLPRAPASCSALYSAHHVMCIAAD